MSHRYPFPIPFGWFCVGHPRTSPPATPSPSTTGPGTSWAGATRERSTCRAPSAPTSAPTWATAAPSTAARSGAPSTAGSTTPRAPTPPSPTASGSTARPASHLPDDRAQRRGAGLVPPAGRGAAVGGARGPRAERPPRLVDWSAPPSTTSTPPSRRWPRTRSTRPTSATCTTPPRCRSERVHHRLPRGDHALGPEVPHPRAVIEGRIDTRLGPGISKVLFSGIIDTVNYAVTTPIDHERCVVRFNSGQDHWATRRQATWARPSWPRSTSRSGRTCPSGSTRPTWCARR